MQSNQPASPAFNFPDASRSDLDRLLERINGLTGTTPRPEADEAGLGVDGEAGRQELPFSSKLAAAPRASFSQASRETGFIPRRPNSLEEAKLTETKVEELILKFLLARGDTSGRNIADQIKLPFIIIEKILVRMKQEQMIAFVGQSTLNDYVNRLTEFGAAKARMHSRICTYYGAAPVALSDYIYSVKAQSIEGQYPSKGKLLEAFNDLLIDESILARLGPAISSGKGMFLYGFPGNGKTSIAERVTKSFGMYIWVPRAISVDGEIVRLFDAMSHEEAPEDTGSGLVSHHEVDERWVRIKRPTIVVGGELTMDHLELTHNPETGIAEAPVQMKSNCGVLVIDDFGRQKMRVDELLNRWIVPLEKRHDYLNLASGKKIQVPFDQLVIFSTNLEPRDLVDDAFMRRIPYKIEIKDPSKANFCKLFKIMARVLDVPFDPKAVEYLIRTHYEPVNRPFRNCQPRDLLLQVRNYCIYNELPVMMSPEAFDFAADCYFSVM